MENKLLRLLTDFAHNVTLESSALGRGAIDEKKKWYEEKHYNFFSALFISVSLVKHNIYL